MLRITSLRALLHENTQCFKIVCDFITRKKIINIYYIVYKYIIPFELFASNSCV